MSPTTAEEKLAALAKGESNEGTVSAIEKGGHYVAGAATVVAIGQGAVGAYAAGGMAAVGCFAAPLAVGMGAALIGGLIANALGADEWLADRNNGPRLAKPGPNPAHITHAIAHSCKFAGLLAGVIVGALVAAVAGAAIVLTGGLAAPLIIAAGAGLVGGFVGTMISGAGAKLANITGAIVAPGSPNVYFEGLPAARVTDLCVCSKCAPMVPAIAEGSETVFINGFPMARVGHKLTCGAQVQEGCKTIYLQVA
jgi:uncharacterized Zn-binding protein involved in type VI secretion